MGAFLSSFLCFFLFFFFFSFLFLLSFVFFAAAAAAAAALSPARENKMTVSLSLPPPSPLDQSCMAEHGNGHGPSDCLRALTGKKENSRSRLIAARTYSPFLERKRKEKKRKAEGPVSGVRFRQFREQEFIPSRPYGVFGYKDDIYIYTG
ncbi:uncharacterized protein ARB_04623 [Trichophyton benhamiae CBS 112371]|uniref:Uncharacterized protein n=1 Tax=Arthroderma benhamiae (strain ATCC MYA-4681 / CBS 112371) TaxID=663331 RepID=D4AK22_ARTBC|nr:uncharacterized protein ARB_04623 [Trichophyton benhamiae CBS 112371]EFE37095.1 hypothetical protein ARB_04623 [Trichophyton benhamiae CBS 112371]